MSTILAIETSAEIASVALRHQGVTHADVAEGVAAHSQTLLPMVQALLKKAGIALAECDAIAFGAGPGSFTGVRTACGAAQGLAFGSNKAVVPVVTLLAMAEQCRMQNGVADVLAVLDARMGEVYWAQYRYDQGGACWHTVTAPTLSSAAEVVANGQAVICGNGIRAYPDAFASDQFVRCDMDDLVPHATHIATLGALAFEHGEGIAARDAEPFYLRNKVALTTSERLAKAAKEAA